MYEPPRGLTLVSKEGHVKYFCSKKCMKNMAMKRRKVEWVRKRKDSKKEVKKEIKEDVNNS